MHTIERILPFDLILNDVKYLLSTMSHSCISFVKQFANRITHELVKKSISMTDCREWSSFLPNFICNMLLDDLN